MGHFQRCTGFCDQVGYTSLDPNSNKNAPATALCMLSSSRTKGTDNINDVKNRIKSNIKAIASICHTGSAMGRAGIVFRGSFGSVWDSLIRSLAPARSFDVSPSSGPDRQARQQIADRALQVLPAGMAVVAAPAGEIGGVDAPEAHRRCDPVQHRRHEFVAVAASCASSRTQRDAMAAFDHSTMAQRAAVSSASITSSNVLPGGMIRSHHTLQPHRSSALARRRRPPGPRAHS